MRDNYINFIALYFKILNLINSSSLELKQKRLPLVTRHILFTSGFAHRFFFCKHP